MAVAVLRSKVTTIEKNKIADWTRSPEAILARRVVVHTIADIKQSIIDDSINGNTLEAGEATEKINKLTNFLDTLKWLSSQDTELYTVQLNIVEE